MLVDIIEQIQVCTKELQKLQKKIPNGINPHIIYYQMRLDKLKKRMDNYGKLLYPQKLYYCEGTTKQNPPVSFKMYLIVSNENEIKPLLTYRFGSLEALSIKEVSLLSNLVD